MDGSTLRERPAGRLEDPLGELLGAAEDVALCRVVLSAAGEELEARVFAADPALFGFDPHASGRVDLAAWFSRIAPEDRERRLALERERRSRLRPLRVRLTLHPGDGTRVRVEEYGWARRRPGGGLVLESLLLLARPGEGATAAETAWAALARAAPVALLLVEGRRVVLANATAARLFGAPDAAALTGLSLARLFGEDVPGALAVVRSMGGGPRPVEVRRTALGEGAELLALVDLAQRAAELERLRRLALEDPLTGLANRLHFEDRLAFAVELARRTGRRVAVHAIDLDRFKPVNDTLGHEAGDELLRQLARRWRQLLRRTDTLARLGGDEFAVVQPEIAGQQAALVLARRLLAALEEPFVFEGREVDVGASVGIALFPDHAADAAALVRLADEALYRAKRGGGERVELAEPAGRPEEKVVGGGQRP